MPCVCKLALIVWLGAGGLRLGVVETQDERSFQMPSEMPKCKITVLKRTINQDLIDEYLDDAYKDTDLCECFEEGEDGQCLT